MRSITTAPGIGDFAWVIMKVINQDEKFDFAFPVNNPDAPVNKNNVQTRAFQLEKLLPQLINSSVHQRIKFESNIKGRSPVMWKDAASLQHFCLEANSWMESGQRIETFLPDLGTSYIIPFETSEENKKDAENILAQVSGHKLCGIYTSNQAKSRESWLEREWIELISRIQEHDPDYKFVFIGAEYDRPMTEAIMSHFDKKDYATCIDQELGIVIELLKRLDIFISFQSGLSIIGELIGINQTLMLYWNDRKHRNIIEAWPDPKRIANGSYKGCVFCPPEQIFNWLLENQKL